MPVKVTTKLGRIRPPQLDNGALTFIGNTMVAAQKERWKKSINASGQASKKLSVKYFFQKRAFQGGRGTPKRDNKLTGAMLDNFTLRKAMKGMIRAENTSRLGRLHATRSQQAEEMIGFAGTDVITTVRAAEAQYGEWVKKAWIPLG
jgi:hypothetical protein